METRRHQLAEDMTYSPSETQRELTREQIEALGMINKLQLVDDIEKGMSSVTETENDEF